jgi:hypothetical protein
MLFKLIGYASSNFVYRQGEELSLAPPPRREAHRNIEKES